MIGLFYLKKREKVPYLVSKQVTCMLTYDMCHIQYLVISNMLLVGLYIESEKNKIFQTQESNKMKKNQVTKWEISWYYFIVPENIPIAQSTYI